MLIVSLGPPYGLYLIGLSTVVDDEVLDWFLKYEMALDSLAGPYAAFILFYNEARLRAEPFPSWEYWRHREWDSERSGAYEIPVPGELLRAGTAVVDDALAFELYKRFSEGRGAIKEALVTSMTYESDSVARELGILEKLPCIVLFDDPNSHEFYVIPLRDRIDVALDGTRKLLSSFFQDPDYVAYFTALREWHDLRDKRAQLEAEVKLLMKDFRPRSYEVRRKKMNSRLRTAQAMLLAGDAKGFRIEVHGAAGPYVNALPWGELRRSSNNIASAVRIIDQLEQLDDSNATQGSQSSLADLLHRAYAILQMDPARGYEEGQDLSELLTGFVEVEAARLMQRIYETFGITSKSRAEITSQAVSEPDYPWSEQAEAVQRLTEILTEGFTAIQGMERPSLGPHINALRRQKKRETAFHALRVSAVTLADKGPSIMSAISGAANLLHGV